MSTFLPAEKGTTIRMPSTANLMIDSTDRDTRFASPANFQITRPQALLNGFFTRIGTTEVVLEYNSFNISGATLTVDVSGGATPTYAAFAGNYTVANLMDFVAARLTNALAGSTWAIVPFNGGNGFPGARIALTSATPVAFQLRGKVAELLGIDGISYITYNTNGGPFVRMNVDLRPFRYLDFVSPELTYNQDLKDSSTALGVRDVLCRWYMAWDQAPEYDVYGFPILMGYKPFQLRRIFSPPKQIRWDNIQPLGNLTFQVFDNTGSLATLTSSTGQYQTNWLMTLQISEV